MLVRRTDLIPSIISFAPAPGCTDIVLLDESLSVIPCGEEGATGIVGLISSQSAIRYLDDEEVSQHMFHPWAGDDILLYTDDIGCMQADGAIVIRGRSSRSIKTNGLFVDLDYVERALAPAFADKSFNVTDFKLVMSNTTERVILFVSTPATDGMTILKRAREHMCASHNDDLASIISFVRCIPEMPFNASYEIDIVGLQKMVNPTETLPCGQFSDVPVTATPSEVDALAEKIAAEVTKLSKSPSAIPTDLPLLYSGITSITIVHLHFWLQSEYEYLEQIDHLFDGEVTAQTIASEILRNEEEVTEEVVIAPTSPTSEVTVVGDENTDILDSETVPDYPVKALAATSLEIMVDEETRDYPFGKEHAPNPTYPSDRPVGTLIVMQPSVETTLPDTINKIATHSTLHFTPYTFLSLSWMTPLLRLGSKRPLLESVVIFVSGLPVHHIEYNSCFLSPCRTCSL